MALYQTVWQRVASGNQPDIEKIPDFTGSDGSREKGTGRAESCPPFLEPERGPLTNRHDRPLLSRRYSHTIQRSKKRRERKKSTLKNRTLAYIDTCGLILNSSFSLWLSMQESFQTWSDLISCALSYGNLNMNYITDYVVWVYSLSHCSLQLSLGYANLTELIKNGRW